MAQDKRKAGRQSDQCRSREYIQAIFLNKDIDTRKALSYFIELSDADTEAFKKNVSLEERKGIADRLIAAIYKHPSDWTMDASQEIYRRLTTVKTSKKCEIKE